MEKSNQATGLGKPLLSLDADDDLSVIYAYTAAQWGELQADMYLAFLNEVIWQVAADPQMGKPLAKRKGIRHFVARWPGARDGHRIVYEIISAGIRVLRILHTSMDAGRHVK